MNWQSFFTKYRPNTFDSMIGQEHISKILKNQVANKKTAWAYIFSWNKWSWKTTTARILARAVNCLNPQNWNPCLECERCQEKNPIDIIEIDAASNTWVDNVREEIVEKLDYTPNSFDKKVYIIDEAHMLSKSAWNALLKTIEETPQHIMFIFATTEIYKIPETILSRCQVFVFKKISNDDIVKKLQYICEKENINYEKSALELIAQMSEWAHRDWEKYLQQVSSIWDVNQENVSMLLGLVSSNEIENILQNLEQKKFDDISRSFEKFYDSWLDFNLILKQILWVVSKNFEKNPSFYSSLQSTLSEILSSVRYHPYPLLLIKAKIWEYINWKNISQTQSSENKAQNNILTNSPAKNSEKNNSEENKSAENKQTENKNIQEKTELPKSESRIETPIQSGKKLDDDSLDDILDSHFRWDPIVEKKSETSNKIENTEKIEDLEILWEKVCENIKKPSLIMLKKWELESIDNWVATIAVLDKFAQTQATKPENKKEIEKIFLDFWYDVQIDVILLDKENFLDF